MPFIDYFILAVNILTVEVRITLTLFFVVDYSYTVELN